MIKIFLKGLLMGICDIIPGVSGGTIAFILGIYERLINSIKSINFKFYTKENLKKIDLGFLIPLGLYNNIFFWDDCYYSYVIARNFW
jgi:putative membrane protein